LKSVSIVQTPYPFSSLAPPPLYLFLLLEYIAGIFSLPSSNPKWRKGEVVLLLHLCVSLCCCLITSSLAVVWRTGEKRKAGGEEGIHEDLERFFDSLQIQVQSILLIFKNFSHYRKKQSRRK
jgi:hypothetical protein